YCCKAHPPYQPFSVCYPSLPIPPLASIQCPPPLSANPSTGLHSVSSTPLCQSLHWPLLSVLHPSLPIPPLASSQCPPPLSANPSTGFHSCPPPLSANPSTGLHSVSSTPLSANPSTDLHSVSSTPLCQSLHCFPLAKRINFKILTTTYKAIPQLCPQLHHQPGLKISTKLLSSIFPRPSAL
ncbi:unnamed protein product, partial [Staurois parvus]